ncbi:hypothetical protein [Amycolatopsis sp. MtRt-6]|uniref:hypothetical protein n=1 Tax=Amycolatopsis sp. MtRt-6 TaxID=2792782 RepID=UPI001A8BFC78|nr:hypothetical protein [Amycolatopsis sp. MtRt-6]
MTPLWLPGFAAVTPPDDVPAVNAAVPLGVPSPVGPSQPVPALHCTAVEQVPLLPEVTSLRFPAWEYG